MGTNAQIMAWIMDTYSMHIRALRAGGRHRKPISVGGSQGRQMATGLGVSISAAQARTGTARIFNRCRGAIQGFAMLGRLVPVPDARARKVVAVTDVRGGVYNERDWT